ncbi:MAG: hypothetical protein EOP50_06265 [Sphingobacteriales bacterium]|nr:MAG: hypothetical protein EOP50_06265 [Sphingobacteriales bacterium]
MNELLTALLGLSTPGRFAALLMLALIGATLSLLLQAKNRDPLSPATPTKFSLSFLVCDNWRRMLTTLILIWAALRFTPQLFGIEINEFFAVAIGFGNDKLSQLVKDKTNLLGQKKES